MASNKCNLGDIDDDLKNSKENNDNESSNYDEDNGELTKEEIEIMNKIAKSSNQTCEYDLIKQV